MHRYNSKIKIQKNKNKKNSHTTIKTFIQLKKLLSKIWNFYPQGALDGLSLRGAGLLGRRWWSPFDLPWPHFHIQNCFSSSSLFPLTTPKKNCNSNKCALLRKPSCHIILKAWTFSTGCGGKHWCSSDNFNIRQKECFQWKKTWKSLARNRVYETAKETIF